MDIPSLNLVSPNTSRLRERNTPKKSAQKSAKKFGNHPISPNEEKSTAINMADDEDITPSTPFLVEAPLNINLEPSSGLTAMIKQTKADKLRPVAEVPPVIGAGSELSNAGANLPASLSAISFSASKKMWKSTADAITAGGPIGTARRMNVQGLAQRLCLVITFCMMLVGICGVFLSLVPSLVDATTYAFNIKAASNVPFVNFTMPLPHEYADQKIFAYDSCLYPKSIALTFDDGPMMTKNATHILLDGLREAGVPGTFFLSPKGFSPQDIHEKCGVVKAILDAGSTVGSHSWTHPDFDMLTLQQVFNEVRTAEEWIVKCSGGAFRPIEFRPPFGKLNLEKARLLSFMGYTMSFWNLDAKDYMFNLDVEGIMTIIKGEVSKYQTRHGMGRSSIVLLQHDVNSATSQNVFIPIKEYFTKQGYIFTRTDGCFPPPGAAPYACLHSTGNRICSDKGEMHYTLARWNVEFSKANNVTASAARRA